MATLDLAALAALRPEAADLTARVKEGDEAACFDAGLFIERVRAMTEPARTMVVGLADDAGRDARVLATDPDDDPALVARAWHDAVDGFDVLVDLVSGVYELSVVLDDVRGDDVYG